MAKIEAIETRYLGFRFRSRLEARWAMAMKQSGIEFVYEPDGYVCDGTPYLPDFYLPAADAFLEIKPAHLYDAFKQPEMTLYMAGRMAAGTRGWRGPFADSTKQYLENGPWDDPGNQGRHQHYEWPLPDGPLLRYVGPFVVDDCMPHNMFGRGQHAQQPWWFDHDERGDPQATLGSAEQDAVRDACYDAISRADLFVAYINDAESYGAINEIGAATTLQMVKSKPRWVYVLLGPNAPSRELWFSNPQDGVFAPEEVWPFVQEISARRCPYSPPKEVAAMRAGMRLFILFGDPSAWGFIAQSNGVTRKVRRLLDAIPQTIRQAARSHRFA